jgi:PEP-CTERM motif
MNIVANTFSRVAAAAVLSLAFSAAAQAQVTFVGSQAAFSALGTTAQNTNFDAYPTDGTFSFPGNPFTVGDLTFVEGGQNLIGGTNSYGFARNLLTDNYVSGTTIQIAGQYDLFALNAGNFFSTGDASFAVTTNLSSYNFVESVSNGAAGFSFIGFQAGAGEYFTSVAISGSFATGMTDVQLAQAVPEPETYALLLAGLGAVVFVARRRRA